jgi:uncharacterized NAD(P)/FAD-binding protein YdhS
VLSARPGDGRRLLAVVGGGASGTLVALAALRRAPDLDVVVVEPRATLGHGVAYSTGDLRHRLNVAAGNMSAFPDEPGHFVEWARMHDPFMTPSAFAPRALYGLYLSELVRAEGAIRPGRLTHVQAAASSVHGGADGWTVRLDGGGSLLADELVIAVGHGTAATPTGIHRLLAGDHAYVADPWSGWTRPPVEGIVLVLGTGLTAVDVAITVTGDNPGARVMAISRHGLRPLEHRPPGSASDPPAPPALRPRTALGLLRSVRAEVALAAEAGGDWRDVVNRLRPSTQDIWRSLPLDERHRFVRRLGRYWEVHRHRVAPDVALTIAELERARRLAFAAGSVVSARREGDAVRVRLRLHGRGDAELDVARIVNCTGVTNGVLGHPLLGRLEAAGGCAPGPLGLGISTGDAGEVLGRDGRPTGAHTLGPLRRGDLWETTSIPEIRAQAFALAETLRSRAPVTARTPTDWRELQLA